MSARCSKRFYGKIRKPMQFPLNRFWPLSLIYKWCLSIPGGPSLKENQHNKQYPSLFVHKRDNRLCGICVSSCLGKLFCSILNHTYLGTLISSTGNFSLALHKLRGKALHTLFSPRKHTNLSKLSPILAQTIFNVIISTILTCIRKIWSGTVARSKKHISDFYTLFRSKQLGFGSIWKVTRWRNECSQIGQCSIQRFLLLIAIKQKVLNNLSDLESGDNCSIATQIFRKIFITLVRI